MIFISFSAPTLDKVDHVVLEKTQMKGQSGEPSLNSRIGEPAGEIPRAPEGDGRWLQTALLAATAIFVGIGIPADDVYLPLGMLLLTCGLLCCFVAIQISGKTLSGAFGQRLLLAVLAGGIAVQCTMLTLDLEPPLPTDLVWPFQVRLVAAGILGLLGLLRSPLLKFVRMAMLAMIFLMLAYPIVKVYKRPVIDVFTCQTRSVEVLMQGGNPFDPHQVRFPNLYPKEAGAVLYGPGAVDFTPTAESPGGTLLFGCPYPPLSLLLVAPGWIWGGDIRYSGIAAILISGLLMAFARPGRIAPLAACLFLLTPRVFYILREAWTEPLLVLTFSLAMFCACRWPAVLPYVLGIFLATKQYTVVLVPLVPLLVSRPGASWRDAAKLLAKAVAVAALLTFPPALWNFHDFWKSVVAGKSSPPFRLDSCSYLVTMARLLHGWCAPVWTPFAAVIPAIGIVLWRGVRTPAGFAAGAAFVCLVLFLFSKQSFSNYYYFVIGAACWAVAAAGVEESGFAPPVKISK
jgi:hypothetical protein